jgi:hypothetical protein
MGGRTGGHRREYKKVERSLAIISLLFFLQLSFSPSSLILPPFLTIPVPTMDVAFDTAHQASLDTSHLSSFFAIDDTADWRATMEPFEISVSETDSSVLDSPVSNSNFNSIFQLDEEENRTNRATKTVTVSVADPGEPHTKASPLDIHDGLNAKDVERCELHDDQAAGVSPGGALATSDGCASPQLLDVPDQAGTLCGSQESEQSLKSPDSHCSIRNVESQRPPRQERPSHLRLSSLLAGGRWGVRRLPLAGCIVRPEIAEVQNACHWINSRQLAYSAV